mmetsp:Transcript_27645/g.87385  ORF Transcript_27645/g.87385 Transcript_27645/m.87385 type:complete len:202 (-) Transcript_27645:148-753(-)
MALALRRAAPSGMYASGTSSSETTSALPGSAPAASAPARARDRTRASAASRCSGVMRSTMSTEPLTRAHAAPTALAQSACSGSSTSAPSSRPPQRKAPPPTTTTVIRASDVRCASTAWARSSCAPSQAALRSGSRAAARGFGQSSFVLPSARARQVVVSVPPPKQRASEVKAWPTLPGPRPPSSRTTVPPPSGTDSTSGIS